MSQENSSLGRFLEGLPLPQRVAVLGYAIGMLCTTALVIARIEWAQAAFIGLLGWGAKSPLFPALPSLTIPFPAGSSPPVVTLTPPPPPPPKVEP